MNSTLYHERKDCRFCGSPSLHLYLDLGVQPPSNSFISAADVAFEKKIPLKVFLCRDCGLSQLTGVVSAAYIFNEYFYLSSTSKALVRHYGSLVSNLVKRFGLRPDDGVLDIGCNDGVMLDRYPPKIKRRIGVEPSTVAEYAKAKGHTVYPVFFNLESARKIYSEQGAMRIMTATNVFAHIDDIHSVVSGIEALLDDDGVFVIEAPYIIDTVDQTLFDTIYHEHLCYLALTPLSSLFEKHGLQIFDAQRLVVGASGPAIRVFVQRQNGRYKRSKNLDDLLKFEGAWGLRSMAPYQALAHRITETGSHLRSLLRGLQAKGARIGGYGAPAKGNTLLNTFQIGPDLLKEGIAETNPIKIGKLTPGSHIPIISEEEFIHRKPEFALLLTWNYLDFFLKNSDYIKAGGRFITPLPRPAIVPESTA